MTNEYDICVIGGGASGLAAAVFAQRSGRSAAVLERQPRVAKKLLATGNGRCNLTNMHPDRERYHGDADFAQRVIAAFPPKAVRAFFRELGVETFLEDEGKVYPMGEQASSVVDALRLSLAECGADEICDFEVISVKPQNGGFLLRGADGQTVFCKRVIVACGGLAAPKLGGCGWGAKLLAPLGHTGFPCLPALVQLKTPTDAIRALKGIKYTGPIDILTDGAVRRSEWGEVLFTEYGISGPPVLQLSRIASFALAEKRNVRVRMHILDLPEDETLSLLRERRDTIPTRTLENFLTGLVNKRLGQTLLKLAGAQPFTRETSTLTDRELSDLAHFLCAWELPVVGTQSFENAQVTAGGLDTRQFDAMTMQSKKVPHLYAAGEMLNVDGDCGGFNLQFAFASGLLAARSAAASLP